MEIMMPQYDLKCDKCDTVKSKFARMAERNAQRCSCGNPLRIVITSAPTVKNANTGGRAV